MRKVILRWCIVLVICGNGMSVSISPSEGACWPEAPSSYYVSEIELSSTPASFPTSFPTSFNTSVNACMLTERGYATGLSRARICVAHTRRCYRACKRDPMITLSATAVTIATMCCIARVICGAIGAHRAVESWLALDENSTIKNADNCTFAECYDGELDNPERLQSLPEGMLRQKRAVMYHKKLGLVYQEPYKSWHRSVTCLFSQKCQNPTFRQLVPNQDSCHLSNATMYARVWGYEGLGAQGVVCQANVDANIN